MAKGVDLSTDDKTILVTLSSIKDSLEEIKNTSQTPSAPVDNGRAATTKTDLRNAAV